jgi:hypothetical protein
MRHTAPWHYVDVPLDEPEYDKRWSADDAKLGCMVDKINKFRVTVRGSGRSSTCGWRDTLTTRSRRRLAVPS